jgi:hypothetical protein
MSSVVFSQEKSTVDYYVDYFKLPRETLFLHTNKTTYMPGEEIWFKVYAYDRKSQLTSKATTNIQLSIFDADGKKIDQKLYYAKEGFAHGNIIVDDSFATGNYFIKVSTNWMKNFKEDDAFVKKISIINPKSDAKEITVNTKEYDIQFLPEGGHLLAGVKNVVGVKAIDDRGKGTRASGIIVDKNGTEIASFQSNFLGLGRFSFTPMQGQTYTAKITLDNTKKLKLPLPKSKERGISVIVSNTLASDVIIDFYTNEQTFDQIKNQALQMLIHKDGVTKIIPVEFTSGRKRFIIAKEALFKGVNTITLFDENQTPLVERMFFNEAPIKTYQLSLLETSKQADSLKVSLQANLELSLVANTSISVLPKGTKSYAPTHNILSAFYLKPYLKGSVENPSYYFTKPNRKKYYELDLLLLTQGWSRYDWKDVFNNTPVVRYQFENGITLNGNVNSDITLNPQLLLQPSYYNKSQFVSYNEKGAFQIKNYYPVKDEKLSFSLIDEKGDAKPLALAVNSLLTWDEETINIKDFEEYRSFYADKNSIPTNFVTSGELLNEVVVSGRLSRVYNKTGPPFDGSVIKVNDSVARRFPSFAEIMNTEKFLVNMGTCTQGRQTGPMGQEAPCLNITPIQRSVFGGPRPVVYFIDGQPIHPMSAHMFFTTPTTQFEDIYIDYSSNNVLLFGLAYQDAIIVNAFSRMTNFESYTLNPNATGVSRTLKHGFETARTFYTPRYIDYTIPSFKEYGVVHWTPNFTLTGTERKNVTIFNTGLKDITLYVEGITSNGDLISQAITIENYKKQ